MALLELKGFGVALGATQLAGVDLVVEPMPVHQAAVLTRGNFRPSDDNVVPHFRKVTEAIRGNGAIAIQQLYHVGQHADGIAGAIVLATISVRSAAAQRASLQMAS